jgi:outer membrane protein TolC
MLDRFADATGGGDRPSPSAALLSVPLAVARALAQRADLHSADDAVAAAQASVAAARRAALPPVIVAGGYDDGVDSGYRIAGPAVSVQVAVPLGGAPADRVRAQAALVDEAIAHRDGVELAIRNEVAAAARTATAAVEAEAATAQALANARAKLDATTTGYAAGASTSLDLSSARSAYEQALVDALNAHFDRLQTAALLALAVAS